jgi:enduracididine beta-hydroxylase
MEEISLGKEDIEVIQMIVRQMISQYASIEDADFIRNLSVYSQELPRRLRIFLNDFRLMEPASAVCLIRGYPINQTKIGKTPEHWRPRATVSTTLEEETVLLLLGALLGDVLTWGTQQDGHLVQDVFPIKGSEYEQLGAGSAELLWWHNEDAFHPYRADYLGLMCLRNPDLVASTVASISMAKIAECHVKALFEPSFYIRPDDSHLEKSGARLEGENNPDDALLKQAYQRMSEMYSDPPKIPILFGNFNSPYLRLDRFLVDQPQCEAAQAALDALIRSLDSILSQVVLQPGDCIFLDNFRAVHGRKAFKAKYDGNDRWLKRISIARDLRKSSSARSTQSSRVVIA